MRSAADGASSHIRLRVVAAAIVAVVVVGCASASGKPTRSVERTKPSRSDTRDPRLVVSPSGVTVVVLRATTKGWLVRTPCGRTVNLKRGTPISHAEVVLDAGHGGRETGAVDHDLVESTLNLDVAGRVERLLRAEGVTTALTRTGDYRLPIAARAEIASAIRPKLLVSMHHNGGPAAHHDGPGTEVYYQYGSTRSKRLAGLLWEDVASGLRQFPAHWTGAADAGAIYRLGQSGDDFYGILRLTAVPAVLIEAAYLSDASQAALLATPAFRDAEARAIARGIQRYLKTSQSGSGYRTPISRGDTDAGGGTAARCEDPPLE